MDSTDPLLMVTAAVFAVPLSVLAHFLRDLFNALRENSSP
jgi:hypothetical protein